MRFDIKNMLSSEIQFYYAKPYQVYQKEHVEQSGYLIEERIFLKQTLKKLIPQDAAVLDIGAGHCPWFEDISSKINAYYAIDSCYSDKNKNKEHSKIYYLKGNAFDYNYKTIIPSVDIVLLSFFLSHFTDESILELFEKLEHFSKEFIIIDSYKRKPDLPSDLSFIQRKFSKEDNYLQLPKRYFHESILTQIALKMGYTIKYSNICKYWFIQKWTKAENKSVYNVPL